MIQSIETVRKEDGNRSIADKIIKRLSKMEKTVEYNHGRWAWELLQNAKDSVADTDRKVCVEIELDPDRIVFRHNGKHFTERDVCGLINQISSKEVEEGQESTRIGKFGTGFLTTHLLSKVIEVEGIVKTVDEEYYHFSFPLNRNGKTTKQLVPKIENAWTAFHKSTEDNQIDEYDEDEFNTSFTYKLVTKEQKEIASTGVDQFTKLIPFVLAFIPVIDSVNIINNINNTTTKFENSEELENDILLSIIKTENKKKFEIKLLFVKDEDVAIASLVEKTKNGYAIKNLKDYPKLFCDLPLIGTEDFHFPVIVNSFYFNPLPERDGVWLKGDGKQEVEENRKILKNAVSLYKKLLKKITKLNFYDYFNICLSKTPSIYEKYFDDNWYKDNIQKALREIIKNNKVIESVSGVKHKIETTKDVYVDFPHAEKKSDRETIWKLCNIDNYFILPKLEHIHVWHELIWNKKYYCTEEFILNFIQDKKDLDKLQKAIGELEVLNWLNSVIKFTVNHQNSYKLFDRYAVIPNQEGNFKKRKELSSDEINDETLKEIALLLGYNYYEDLIHKDIRFKGSHSKTTIQAVAAEISKLIKYDESIDDNRILAIRKLAEWFEYNSEKGKTYFEAIYSRKEKLFVDTIKDKDNLYRVLKSKTPLSKLSKISKAIEDDPEIIDLIARRIKERAEEKERNKVGEKVEKVLAKALQKYGFKVTKKVYGKDLVITLKKKNAKYAVEVKSTSRASYVSMTPFQAETAVKEADNYALCVVQKNGSVINADYIRKNARFVIDIGDKLQEKFEEVSEFETNKREIANTNDDIDLFYENNLDYKYKISHNIWSKGAGFGSFVNHINDL